MPANYTFIIPVSTKSKRLPEKALLPSHQFPGKLLFFDVFERVRRTIPAATHRLYVTSDDRRIRDLMIEWGYPDQFVHTGLHNNGTQRAVEAARILRRTGINDYIVNLQCDEVFFPVTEFDHFFRQYEKAALRKQREVIGTFISPLSSLKQYHDPNTVKVATANDAEFVFAQYFSRSSIPYFTSDKLVLLYAHQHIGVYCGRVAELEKFGCHPQVENLEQINPLLSGIPFFCYTIPDSPLQINTQEDYEEYKKQCGSNFM